MKHKAIKATEGQLEERQNMVAELSNSYNKLAVVEMLADYVLADQKRIQADESKLTDSPVAYDLESEKVTLTAHFRDCKDLTDVLDNANHLAAKSRDVLDKVRLTMEYLKDAQHPLVKIRVPFHLKANTRNDDVSACSDVIDRQISAINELLGDRP